MIFYEPSQPQRAGAKTPPVTLHPAAVFADPETIALRLLICYAPCQFNRGGKCVQCCGAVPINNLVRLRDAGSKKKCW